MNFSRSEDKFSILSEKYKLLDNDVNVQYSPRISMGGTIQSHFHTMVKSEVRVVE